MNNISVFLPLRAGSARIPRKNTRPFHPDGSSLFQVKLRQLSNIADRVAEVVVSTDDPEVFAQFDGIRTPANVRIVDRPPELASSTTVLQDLIRHVPTVVSGEWIAWTHVTSPFFDEAQMLAAFVTLDEQLRCENSDSLMTVDELRQFIWSDTERTFINFDRSVNQWPHTQDLEMLYAVNSALFVAHRLDYETRDDRIGTRPALYTCSGLASFDIDWPDDFEVAQALAPIFGATAKADV
ncbi:cytidylyltransferase domain-containing protein [Altericroceibacterium xinjiangense]|uniref:acylneuraminate cytidylyltransferase family protein n=1 Tax=Altericroceibacterium xinjiangense TaxID=762261 RepID=UPI000F7D88EC|nr:acylneuraminate cytidylyltransferase family protein [Altericroceibacterium xinjiangense]